MRLNIFSSKYVSLLERDLATTDNEQAKEIINNYNSDNINISADKNDLIEGPEIMNLPTLDPKNEYTSAVAIYSVFNSFSALQASDKRIWATLTHMHYSNYTSKRWQGQSLDTIRSRWLFAPSERVGLVRNSISRLWWAAHLTHSPWIRNKKLKCFKNINPYKYTKILTDSSQLWFDILERSWGSNDICRICFIEAFDRLVSDSSMQIAKTELSNKLAVLFTAKLVPQLIYTQTISPEGLVDEIIGLAEFI